LAYDKRPRPEGAEHIDYGLGLLSQDAIAAEPADGAFDLADVYRRLAREGRLGGFEVTQRFYEIGSFDGIRETETYLLERGKA
jgi:hypothetical protein